MGSLMNITLEAANLHCRKQYRSAIKLLNSHFDSVTDKNDLAQFHTNYAMNYEKLKDIENCNHHCEEAVRLCHFGTYVYKRLIINYVKAKEWGNALRICDIALDKINRSKQLEKENRSNIGYMGTPLHWGNFDLYMDKRREFILKKIKEEQ